MVYAGENHPPSHVFLALFPDLDIHQDQRVHPDRQVLLETVIPALWRPRLGVERERERLAEIVHLQTCRAERGEDRGVVDDLGGDGQLTAPEQQVGVCRRTGGGVSLAPSQGSSPRAHVCFLSPLRQSTEARDLNDLHPPERIPYDQKGHIDLVGIPDNLVRLQFHHLPRRRNDWSTVELFLSPTVSA